VSFTEKLLRDFVLKKNIEYSKQPIFNKNPIKMSKLNKIQASEVFYDSEEILKRHLYVGEIVKQINRTGNKQQYRKVKNVGTVGTYRCDEGQIVLAIDMRGINKTLRNKMISEITYKLDILKEKNEIDYKELAGGGDPVAMDPKLVDLAYRVVKENNIGRVVKDFSPAGQDSQNFARAGHPAVMIFIPSRNGGIAHTPEEYSTPKDLQRGAQALAGLVYNLATTL
jgi:acetylornithine deacetylase/succinyl-diaminopimelate desuccinylase-like protein